MHYPKSSIWPDAPTPAIPEPPALASDSDTLWLAYFNAMDGRAITVVRFDSVIDQHLSPINDEGLGRHAYAKAGLQFYAFNELIHTEETERWSALKARHWVVTFKDNTLDVVAKKAEVVVASMHATSPLSALLDPRFRVLEQA